MKNKEKSGDRLRSNLNRLMSLSGISRRGLSTASGVPYQTVSGLLSGKANHVRWYTLYLLSKGLGCTMEEIIEGADINVIDDPDIRRIVGNMPPEAKAFFRLTRNLPPDDVEAVIRIMKAIVDKYHGDGSSKRKH